MSRITENAVRTTVYVLFDKVANRPLREVPDGFIFARLDGGEPDATDYPTMDAALDAIGRAGGDVKVYALTKYVEPE